MLSVLLVDPHSDTRELYREWLQMAGMRVHESETASEALKLIPRADVVVTETVLPGEPDAFSFIAGLRRDPRTRTLPIVVVSASGPTVEARARAAGCDVFLAKPCLPEQLHLELYQIERSSARSRMARVPLIRSIRNLFRRLG